MIPSKKKQKHFPGSPAIPSLLSPPQTKRFVHFFQREISITLSPPLSSFSSPSSSSLPTPQLNSQPLVTPHYLSKSHLLFPSSRSLGQPFILLYLPDNTPRTLHTQLPPTTSLFLDICNQGLLNITSLNFLSPKS